MDTTLFEALPVLGGAALVSVLVGYVIFRGIFRVWRTTFAVEIRRRGRWAWRTAIGATGALVALETQPVDPDPADVAQQMLALVIIGAVTWLAVALLRAGELAANDKHDVTQPDNLRARRIRTRFVVLRRTGTAIIVVVGLATALLTFPQARALGASLLASAGLVGIVVGVAAQGALRNLVAGIQIAFAEPIRLDDAVVVDGEWGWIEDITLTTVIVRVWDKRRLIYPTSWFIENPFQNWTRRNADLLGEVSLKLDARTDVAALRQATGEIVERSALWDGEMWNVQVTGADERGITVRILASARDAPTAWELRCHVREAVVAWLVDHDPQALPVLRVVTEG